MRVVGAQLFGPLNPFGRVEPSVSQLYEPPRRLGDGKGVGVGSVVGGGYVGRQPFGEGKALEGGGRGVAGTVPQTRAESEGPRSVKSAVQNAEGRVICPGDDDQLMVGTDACVKPDEQPVFDSVGVAM